MREREDQKDSVIERERSIDHMNMEVIKDDTHIDKLAEQDELYVCVSSKKV